MTQLRADVLYPSVRIVQVHRRIIPNFLIKNSRCIGCVLLLQRRCIPLVQSMKESMNDVDQYVVYDGCEAFYVLLLHSRFRRRVVHCCVARHVRLPLDWCHPSSFNQKSSERIFQQWILSIRLFFTTNFRRQFEIGKKEEKKVISGWFAFQGFSWLVLVT